MNNPTTVRDLLILWREKFPDRPWSWFALRCGLSATTLQRIFEEKIEKPSYSSARILALHVLQKEHARFFLSELFPKRTRQIDSDFQQFQSIDNSANEKLIGLYRNYYKFRIYGIAASTGITLEQAEKLGPIYAAKFSEMLGDDLIYLKNGLYCARELPKHIIDPKFVNSIAGYITRTSDEKFQSKTADEDGHISFKIDGMNEEGFLKVNEILQKAFAEACEVCDSGKYKGNLSASFLTLNTRFD